MNVDDDDDDEEILQTLEEWTWNGLVVLFYLPVALGSLLWIHHRGGSWALRVRTLGEQPLQDVGLGLLVAIFVVLLTQAVTPRWRPARRMAQALAGTLGPLSWGTCVLMATFSSVGEELLFRGVIQQEFGIWIASGLFALAHVPMERALLLWPVFAFGVGLLLGGLYAETGAVLAPAVTHFVVNLVNLRWLARWAEPS